MFPPRSQVLNSPGKASHVLRAEVQVYLRRGKCYYRNYNSFKKQSVAVSIQDHKNAHQLNSFLLGTFQAAPEAGRHQGMGVRPSNWVTLSPQPPPALGMSSRAHGGDHREPLPVSSCLNPEQGSSSGFLFSKVEPWWYWYWCWCYGVCGCAHAQVSGGAQGGEGWGFSSHPPSSTSSALVKYKHGRSLIPRPSPQIQWGGSESKSLIRRRL